MLCLPVLLPAALRAPSFRLADLQPAILATPVMTACALIGRAVAIAAALVALAALGRIATRLAGRRASLWAEAFAAANFSFAYYGRATNLDGPALMWTALSVERLLRAGEGGDARDLTAGAVFAALAVATKDQSYATFVLVLPLVAIGFARAREARGGAVGARSLARAAGLAALVYGAASGALFNPTGFVTRLRTLGGPASGDYRAYTRDARRRDGQPARSRRRSRAALVALAGRRARLDGRRAGDRARGGRARRDAPRRSPIGLLGPLAAGAGCLVAFTLVVGRAEHRFVLPLGFWLSFYVGLALEAARAQAAAHSERLARRGRRRGRAAAGAEPGRADRARRHAVGRRPARGRALAGDARARAPPSRPTVRWSISRGSRSAAARGVRVARVGPEPVAGRNPQAGMDERRGRIADVVSRSPDVVLLTEGFAAAYVESTAAAPVVCCPRWRVASARTQRRPWSCARLSRMPAWISALLRRGAAVPFHGAANSRERGATDVGTGAGRPKVRNAG